MNKMTKIAVVEDKKCDICEQSNTELLEVTKEGVFVDTKIKICQSCVSKWFGAFRKNK
jgi:hypothetical protein